MTASERAQYAVRVEGKGSVVHMAHTTLRGPVRKEDGGRVESAES